MAALRTIVSRVNSTRMATTLPGLVGGMKAVTAPPSTLLHQLIKTSHCVSPIKSTSQKVPRYLFTKSLSGSSKTPQQAQISRPISSMAAKNFILRYWSGIPESYRATIMSSATSATTTFVLATSFSGICYILVNTIGIVVKLWRFESEEATVKKETYDAAMDEIKGLKFTVESLQKEVGRKDETIQELQAKIAKNCQNDEIMKELAAAMAALKVKCDMAFFVALPKGVLGDYKQVAELTENLNAVLRGEKAATTSDVKSPPPASP
ncbi:hypothetical protein EJB05_41064 [Eragrostis curvula]|uniref:Uncharacterized protein n=1 Tax=Eragrostis curvula TaxID=38414 RepID=A0A5J9T9S6_9POAL|nr:hypothetical protein EJB05_41064 [Eragrostis curvula]